MRNTYEGALAVRGREQFGVLEQKAEALARQTGRQHPPSRLGRMEYSEGRLRRNVVAAGEDSHDGFMGDGSPSFCLLIYGSWRYPPPACLSCGGRSGQPVGTAIASQDPEDVWGQSGLLARRAEMAVSFYCTTAIQLPTLPVCSPSPLGSDLQHSTSWRL